MKINIYKEDMELIEKALRDEVELLKLKKLMNQNRVLDYEILNAEDLLDRFLFIKRVYGYKDISKLI